ncbi:MAG: hypothetical protein U9N35_08425 [Euryarchaeota archaeon]|nr:hypothetical protein [Euryarchaeota archaeon]
MKQIDMEKAIEIVKDYFNKVKGERKMFDRPFVEWLGFDVISAEEKDEIYVIKCELTENPFTTEKHKYTVKLDTRGEIRQVKRE